MKMKKINAWISLCLIFSLLIHAGYQCVAYINFYYNPAITHMTADICACLLVLHVICGIIIMIGAGKNKGKPYAKLNLGFLLQRISGFVIFVILFFHVAEFKALMNAKTTGMIILVVVLQILFFGLVFLHLSLSFTKALITLGFLDSMEKKKKIDRCIGIVSCLAFVAVSVIILAVQFKIKG